MPPTPISDSSNRLLEKDDNSPPTPHPTLTPIHSTRRLKLVVAYRGTAYHGWQQQGGADDDSLPTVQQVLRNALVRVVRHPVALVGSSRTDAGVHAKGQVAHFDTDQSQIPLEGLRRAVNSRLPADVLVRSIGPAAGGFHAIASTVSKRYQYAIWTAEDRPVFAGDLAWHRPRPLDVDLMGEAASRLVGEHDFTTFARPGHGRATAVRTVHACTVSRRGPRIVIGVEGSGFLWNMVRIIAGTLVDVGRGRFAPSDVPAMLAAKDRAAAGGTAPAHGLYLQWVRSAVAPAEPAAAPDQPEQAGV